MVSEKRLSLTWWARAEPNRRHMFNIDDLEDIVWPDTRLDLQVHFPEVVLHDLEYWEFMEILKCLLDF